MPHLLAKNHNEADDAVFLRTAHSVPLSMYALLRILIHKVPTLNSAPVGSASLTDSF